MLFRSGGRLFCRSSEAVDSSGYGAGAGSGWLTGIPVGGVGSVHGYEFKESIGTSLSLINFGIDEFVNPRLRSTGLNARSLRKRGIRPRIGFTPVVYEAKEDRA